MPDQAPIRRLSRGFEVERDGFVRIHAQIEILGMNHLAFSHDHRALHAVFEFANIARPPPAVDRRKGI